jgi:hypothetical protein
MRSFIRASRILTTRPSVRLLATSQQQQQRQQRDISTSSAKALLRLNQAIKPTVKELRYAYFEMAKKCHPDVKEGDSGDDLDFLKLTEAYEHLLHSKHTRDNEDANTISLEEEEIYRQACLTVLGIPAEIVEESKQNQMFRKWLSGNTDAAQTWKGFLAVHGGLAQRLKPLSGYLEGGSNMTLTKGPRRRPKR